MHPLATLLEDAIEGRFPPADGGWHRVPPWRDGVEAVLAFTGHAVLAVSDDVSEQRLTALGVDGFGGAHHPRVLVDLAGPDGWIDSLDALIARRGTGGGTPLVDRRDLATHPRAAFAQAVRDEVRVLGRPDEGSRSLTTVSRGIAGLFEISVEIDPAERGHGEGTAMIRAALAAIPHGEPVLAAVAPGNAASLRAFLAAEFAVVGSVQVLRPRR
ncbi:MAG TPA: hypothetical protein VFE19_06595 [Jatrophihabitantaceae bacterium]|nr:hypothetical protein [Jatrophihabitantaceae bacterium]